MKTVEHLKAQKKREKEFLEEQDKKDEWERVLTGKKREQEISIAELKGIGPLGDFWQSYLGKSHATVRRVTASFWPCENATIGNFEFNSSESSQDWAGVDHICLFLSLGSHFVVKYNLTHRTN